MGAKGFAAIRPAALLPDRRDPKAEGDRDVKPPPPGLVSVLRFLDRMRGLDPVWHWVAIFTLVAALGGLARLIWGY